MFKKWLICTFLIIYSFAFGYSEQVVVSQFNIGLRNSNNYSLDGVSPNTTMGGISLTGGLEGVIEGGFSNGFSFEKVGTNYSYPSTIGTGIILPVIKNSENNLKQGKFTLYETSTIQDTGETVKNNLIEENFNLPVRMGVMTVSTIQNTGKKITFKEFDVSDAEIGDVRKNHLEAYKIQQYMIRIVKNADIYSVEDTRLDIEKSETDTKKPNWSHLASNVTYANEFINSQKKYIDFFVNSDIYDKEQVVSSSNTVGDKIKLRFLPGNIEIYGLANGKYRIEVYSLKYSKDTTSRGSLIITKEGVVSFDENTNLKEKSIAVSNFSTENFTMIKATLITASTLANPKIAIQESYNGGAFTNAEITKKIPTLMTNVYIDGVKVDLVDGKEVGGGLYYNTWEIEYTVPNTTLDDKSRQVKFTMEDTGGNKEVILQYELKLNLTKVTGDPIQTVFINTTKTLGWTAPFEIADKNMSKYTEGYKKVKTGTATSVDNLYNNTNNFSLGSILKSNIDTSFNWVSDVGAPSGNSIIINKVMSDSKGTFKEYTTGKEYGTFYTTNWTPNLSYSESTEIKKYDVATFGWQAPDTTSFNTTIKQDKVIFRIVKSSSTDSTTVNGKTVKNYFYPYNESNGNPLLAGITNLSNFISGTATYVDLIFNAGTSSSITYGDATFTYSTTRNFYVTGLKPKGIYQLQIYGIQGEDANAEVDNTYNYKVLTYGDCIDFTMGDPKIVTSDSLASDNDMFIINSKIYTDSGSTRNVNVEFITKARQKLSLGVNNLISRKDEISKTGGTIGEVNEIRIKNSIPETRTVTNLALSNTKSDFQYPLDIVFLIDSSGSMLPKVQNMKAGLSNFSKALVDRGFDVKFNMIAFGSPLTTHYNEIDGYEYTRAYDIRVKNSIRNGYVSGIWHDKVSSLENGDYAVKYKTTWFDGTGFTADAGLSKAYDIQKNKELKELTDAFNQLNPYSGYISSGNNKAPENAFHAIHYGIQHLNGNGRYLDLNNNIVSHSEGEGREGYVKSEKMLILLTDENGATINLPTGYDANNIVSKLSDALKSSGINLTSINKTSVDVSSIDEYNNYVNNNATNTDYKYDIATQLSYSWIGTDNETHRIDNVDGIAVYDGKTLYITQDENNSNRVNYANLKNGSTYYRKRNSGGWREVVATGQLNSDTIQINDRRGVVGNTPNDIGGRYISEFILNNLGNKFNMYSIDEDVGTSLVHSADKLGIVQTWNMTYNSPFTESDAIKREVIFSLRGLTKTGTTEELYVKPRILDVNKDRFYDVTEEKIKATLLKPHKNTDTTQASKFPTKYYRKLVKENGRILLEAEAISQYKDTESSDGQLINNRIIKGTFIIKGTNITSGLVETWSKTVVPTENQKSDGLWYLASTEISTEEFNKKFGKTPSNVSVTFIAETEKLSIQDEVDGVTVVDATAPIITDFKMTNVTLKDFMEELKDKSSTAIFGATEITSATAVTVSPSASSTNGAIEVSDFSDKKLNVKASDNISIEITLDDESIINTSRGVIINYNGIDYTASFNGNVSGSDTKTKWIIGSVENPISTYLVNVNKNHSITFRIADDSGNSASINGGNVEVFNEVIPLSNTSFSTKPSDDSYKGDNTRAYYNRLDLDVEKIDSALAYLFVFDYDISAADNMITTGGTYPQIHARREWISSSEKGKFDFYNGRHLYYGTVYTINKAGAILGITHTSSGAKMLTGDNSLTNVLNAIPIPGEYDKDKKTLYIDTVPPVVNNFDFRKYSDMNLNKSDLLNNHSDAESLLIGSISSDRPYKESDLISFNFGIQESHFFKTILDEGFLEISLKSMNGVDIAIDSNGLEGAGNYYGGTSYKIRGTAIDLTLGSAGNIDKTGTIKVYDKAGNITPLTFTANYDDSVPGNISVASIKEGNGFKFTNNINLPLKNIDTNNDFSVALLESELTGKKYVGKINQGGIVNLTAFTEADGITKFPPNNNGNNPIKLTTFSKSGKAGNIQIDGIVLDTKINDDRTSIIETVYTRNGGSYVVDLTDTLSTIDELVGLASYSISTNATGVRLQHGSVTSNLSSTGISVDLSSQSLYSSQITTTPYSLINNLILASPGITSFKLNLTDRLGNPATIDYTVQIPNNINIIGKKANSTKIINTKVNNSSNKMKIESRIE